jgi:pilus assembly protein Flp/PilA
MTLAHVVACATTRFSREETGATAVEYGLLVALIAAVIIAAVILLGGTVLGIFTDFNSDFTSATG